MVKVQALVLRQFISDFVYHSDSLVFGAQAGLISKIFYYITSMMSGKYKSESHPYLTISSDQHKIEPISNRKNIRQLRFKGNLP